MYHILASINGAPMRRFDFPKSRYNAAEMLEIAVNKFSHNERNIVAVADHSGIVRYVSHTGQRYF